MALNPDTGKLVWYFQPSPHDVHDWDAVQTPVLFDADFHGTKRKLLAQASRNGYFFVLDRATGKNLLTAPFIETNWASGIDCIGRPIAKVDKYPKPDGSLVEPASDGSTNWMAPSFDPDTGLFYVSARRIFSVFYKTATGKARRLGRPRPQSVGELGAASHRLSDRQDPLEPRTRRGRRRRGNPDHGGRPAVHRRQFATTCWRWIAATGKTLWHVNAGGGMESSPMTYELGGKQYVLTAVQDI